MYHRRKCEKCIEYEEILIEFSITKDTNWLRERTGCQGVDREEL
jgi:hypothetical protein